MSFIRRIFARGSSGSSKNSSLPDSPTNKVIKKILFYGFFGFTFATIVSKKYRTNLIFTFEPNDNNRRLIDDNAVFHDGVYYPTYWMFFGPLQRFYAKYFEELPYFRSITEPATKQLFQTHELPVADKFSKVLLFDIKKENLPVALIVAGWGGLNIGAQKIMLSMNINGFKTYCLRPDDFHSEERLKKTVQKIKSEHPNSKIFGVGVDYGANLLVNYAAKNEKGLNGVVSIGNPLNLEESEKNVENSNFFWKKLLYNDMLKGRIESCLENKKLLGESLKINEGTTSLHEIDRTCYNGIFQDYSQLKQKLSSVNQIKNLKVPSLFIQSQEDPFSVSIEQNEEKLENSKCIYVETQRGGHGEWFESMRTMRWVSRPVINFLRQLNSKN